MFSNTTLDVFIGLISIFLLYSLLASILMEALAKYFGLRARITLKAISKLLEDSKYTSDNAFWRFFSSISHGSYINNLKGRNLTALFYAHPNIKNLGKNDLYRKPSTISSDLFCDTFIQTLRGDGYDGKENQIEAIKRNLQLDNADKTKFGVLDIPSWYFNAGYKPLGSTTKTIVIHKLTLYQLQQFLYDAHSDIDIFRQKLAFWYNEMMDRSVGWYTKQTRVILFILGVILAIIFNINTIYMAKKLAADKDVRDKMVQFASHLQSSPDINKNTDNAILDKFKTAKISITETQTIIGRKPFECFKPIDILGWLISAFAISLGAPFWFDLLSKIMNIRQTGDKSSKDQLNKSITATSTEQPIG